MSKSSDVAISEGLRTVYEWPDEMTVVNRLCICGSSNDISRTKSHAEGILDSADLDLSGLPRESILCIRRMSDPLPGTLELWRSTARVSPEWERAYASRIEGLARGAARPIREVVPASAVAVLFADRAELLASLATDWISGELLNHWWWRTIYHGTCVELIVVNEWLRHPGNLPPALEHLRLRGEVIKFVKSLGEEGVHRLTRAMILSFGLNMLWPIIDGDLFHREAIDAVEPVSPRSMRTRRTEFALTSSPAPLETPEAPWTRWVPESDHQSLDVVRQLFLGVGLMLHRAVSVVHSPAFAREVTSWYRREKLYGREVSALISSKPGATDEEIRSIPVREIMEVKNIAGEKPGTKMHEGEMQGTGQIIEHSPFVKHLPQKSIVQVRTRSQPGEHIEAITEHRTVGRPPDSVAEGDSLRKSRSYSSRMDMLPLVIPGDRIETELGGLFYLINVAISLDLYPDFTRPLDAGLSMPIWDFVEIVGRRTVAGRFKHDPVWTFLARLAGRSEGEPPGKYFEPPNEWRIPADWLKPFGDHSIWTWSVRGSRLCVCHREGFCILDVCVKRDARQTLRKEIGLYAGSADFALRRGRPGPAAAPSLEWWLSRLVPFLLARLRLAFCVGRSRDAVRLLLNHHAEVEKRDARLDIHLALADLPIGIRLAGLDHDPGWVPAGGRFVSFHYS